MYTNWYSQFAEMCMCSLLHSLSKGAQVNVGRPCRQSLARPLSPILCTWPPPQWRHSSHQCRRFRSSISCRITGTYPLHQVVFLTTLFYLLCYSSDVYLPVRIVLDIIPSVTQSDTAGHYTASFSRAIRSVFHASFSRLVFYGLYTWLVHTAFGLPVSILPAVLAAIAGALPFVGTYWIALPAVLELWLVEGQTLSAITVLLLSLLPLFFVDSIIYGEVEG
jgi:predicted PurR-regulated permease PerM